MRNRFRWIFLLVGLLALPAPALAQYDVPPVVFTGPLSHPRYEDGGFYVGIDFLYWRTNRPLWSQNVAVRGILDLDGSISGVRNQFIGSGEPALDVGDVHGPGNFQPGWNLTVGWRFQNGIVVELGWRHLVQARYTAFASILAPSFNNGNAFENTFLFAPVTNVPLEFAGNPQNIPQGSTAATFGIWNGASYMSVEYTQRFDTYEINARVPIWEAYDWRSYGLFGPRVAWIWDRFRWRTVDVDVTGASGPGTTGIYSNTVSNRMYGVHAGFGNDWFLGSTPIGGFSFVCDLEAGLYLNLVKANSDWDLADGSFGVHRHRKLNSIVPSAEARLGFKWYPWEAISIDFGWDIMLFFNTIASQRPIDFNMGTNDPEYNHQFLRYWHGFRAGISFVF